MAALDLEQLTARLSDAVDAFRARGRADRHAVAFETLASGVAAGRKAGFREVVAVERHGASQAMRREGADVVVRDLDELLDPTLR